MVSETSTIRKTLPGAAYHSDETYALDKERVFYRNWIYVGRAERVAKPGAWLRVEIADESILVVRGKDDAAARVLQRLPAPRLPDLRRRAGRGAHPPALSVPRLGLRPGRHAW